MTDEMPSRGSIELPDALPYPRMLDFFDLQGEEHTNIHQFYEHLHDGQLTTTACRRCDDVHFPPRTICPDCLSEELIYIDLPHEGELYTFTEVRGTGPIGPNSDTPFVTGIVDLGNVRLSARIDNASYEELSIGDPVELKLVEIEGPGDLHRIFYRFVPR